MKRIEDVIPITAKKLGISEEQLLAEFKLYNKRLTEALKSKPYLEYDFYFLGKLRYGKTPVKILIRNFRKHNLDVSLYEKVLKLFDKEYKEKAKRWKK